LNWALAARGAEKEVQTRIERMMVRVRVLIFFALSQETTREAQLVHRASRASAVFKQRGILDRKRSRSLLL
jgi:hypothetical protein